jgi:hypothetical protein
LAAVVAIWLAAVCAYFAYLLRYSSAAGTPEMHLPAATGLNLRLDGKTATLVLFLHPKCPCSRATVSELERLLSRSQGRLVAKAFLVAPAGGQEEWAATWMANELRTMPGVELQIDVGGKIARSQGIATSGDTILFDKFGKPRFEGGLTDFRGHEGTSAGADRIIEILDGKQTKFVRTPVYGCSLGELGAQNANGVKQ